MTPKEDNEKPVEFYFDPTKKFFKIDNKYYKVKKITSKKKSDHLSKEILVEVDMDEYNDKLERIIEYIQSTFDEKKFLTSLLEGLPMNEIELIERRIQKNSKVKEKEGCYNIMIGDYELPIVD